MPAIMKTVTATFKALPAVDPSAEAGEAVDPPGTFEALVAVFGNEDRAGDIVEPGAFAKSLKRWAESGRLMAAVWSHQFGNIDAFLGHYSVLEETDEGLKLKGHLHLDHPHAARVYELMRQGIIAEFSWSGEILDYEVIEPEDPDDPFAWWFAGIKIFEVDLWEAGPCFKGMNPETQLLGIKASDMTGPLGERIRRQGKTLSASELDSISAMIAGRSAEAPAGPEPEVAVTDEEIEDGPEPTTGPDDDGPSTEDASTPTDVQRASAATKARALLELIENP